MTLSARTSTEVGIVIPRVLALFRLTTSSNTVGRQRSWPTLRARHSVGERFADKARHWPAIALGTDLEFVDQRRGNANGQPFLELGFCHAGQSKGAQWANNAPSDLELLEKFRHSVTEQTFGAHACRPRGAV
jgi:hypothetical protein